MSIEPLIDLLAYL